MANILDRIFGKKEIEESTAQTAPLSLGNVEASDSHHSTKLTPPQLIVGSAQSIGKVRDHNEDSLFVLNTVLAGEDEGIPVGLFIIADGMGGHQHGEVASDVAVRAMAGNLIRKLFLPIVSEEVTAEMESLQEVMLQGIQIAQEAVKKQAPGGGTTLTTAFLLGDQLTIAHVGDSRAYFYAPDNDLQVITRDHSLVRRLQELGQLTEKEAAVHPQRNVLYRAIGQGEPFDPDINTHPFPNPGGLLLCSDGLWGIVPEDKISAIIKKEIDPVAACNALVEAANAAGGPDNISVILVKNFV